MKEKDLFERTMPISRKKKEEIIAKVEEGLKTAESVVFVGFKGMKLGDQNAMRKELRAKGVSYYVAKKSLVERALVSKNVTGEMPISKGETALVWSKDPIAAAKGIFEFSKKFKDNLTLFGGVYQGAYQSQTEILALATIPSREELYSKFVGMLQATYGNVVRAMEQKRQQMETASPAPVAAAVAESVAEVAPEAPVAPAEAVPAVA
jgi:large subunit ribosomal protein L10